MKFLWTRSTLLSKKWDIITFWLGEPVSHFALQIGTRVFHWNFFGFHNDNIEVFKKSRIIVYEIQNPIKTYKLDILIDSMNNRWRGGSYYDYVYFFWLTWRGFLRVLFRVPIPYKEPFGETTYNFICHEAIEALPKNIRPKYDRSKANTPYRLFVELGGE